MLDSIRMRQVLGAFALTAACVCLPAADASAIENMFYFTWANQANASHYLPNPTYEYHALGSTTSIDHIGVGRYRINWGNGSYGFYGLNLGGRTVTAYDNSNDYCILDGGIQEVACYDATGNQKDSRFVASITAGRNGDDEPYATVMALEPSNPSYQPTGFYTAANLPVPITRTGVGQYTVQFPGFGAIGTGGGNVQITANRPFSAGANHRCVVVSWNSTDVFVRCFDPAGALADTAFSLVYHKAEADLRGVAFAWADNASSSAYTPSTTYSYNPTGGAISASRSSTGVYSITFAGMGSVGIGGGNVQVTAYSASDRRCKVNSWLGDTVHVRCFDTAGNPVDTPYSVFYRKPIWKLLTEYFAAAHVPGSTPIGIPTSVIDRYNRHPGPSGQSPVVVTRLNTGTYSVEFTDIHKLGYNGGNAQITASGFAGNYCNVVGWLFDTVTVQCFSQTTSAINQSFQVALFMPRQDNEQLAYVRADNPAQPIQTPPDHYTHNPSGGLVQITRLATPGLVRVTFTGLSAYGVDQGVPIVTAYGPSSDRCKLVSWNGDDVDVICLTALGAVTYASFSLIWFKPDEYADGFATAYADIEATAPGASYPPLTFKSHNPAYEYIAGLRLTFGEYEMHWEGFEEHAAESIDAPCACRRVRADGGDQRE